MMSSKKKNWQLFPFGGLCYSQCENELEGAFFCFIMPVYVVLVLALIAFLSSYVSYEVLKNFPIGYYIVVNLAVALLSLFFWKTWKFVRKSILRIYCRHCR